mmetsp:Transcript_18694/g.31860  ORF Transcript_18694/g.31860 Transcript_18694/m.31860 type:complete len:94 (+) Transcript_18694:409-690(+)
MPHPEFHPDSSRVEQLSADPFHRPRIFFLHLVAFWFLIDPDYRPSAPACGPQMISAYSWSRDRFADPESLLPCMANRVGAWGAWGGAWGGVTR